MGSDGSGKGLTSHRAQPPGNSSGPCPPLQNSRVLWVSQLVGLGAASGRDARSVLQKLWHYLQAEMS